MQAVDDLFTPDALAVFLTSTVWGDVSDDPRVEVDVPNRPPVYVDRHDLKCSGCGGAVDPPRDKPAKWLAINKAVHAGDTHCTRCMKP